MEENKAGKNEILVDGLNNSLNRIYREIGRQQGLSFYENDFMGRNRQIYKQEIISVLETKGVAIELTDIFSNQMTDEISKKMYFYECMEKCENLTSARILREYNSPEAECIYKLRQDLDNYKNEKTDVIIQASLLCYQFLTIMPYEENNVIWMSILLNCFLREKEVGTDYYNPFARYLQEQENEQKRVMKQVREDGDYGIWIRFFVKIMEKAFVRTNQMIMQMEQIRKTTLFLLNDEKQKSLLQEVLVFMEENPIFVIGDIEKNFHTAYNTAAKSVAILEKHELVKEISNKQRYRVYCYERYLQEILK